MWQGFNLIVTVSVDTMSIDIAPMREKLLCQLQVIY